MLYRRTKRENMFILLFMIFVGLGIGYAFIQTDLSITGIGNFNNHTWNIYFEDLTLNPGNVELSTGDVAATINQTTLTDITFTVTLKEPGDFYEFEVAATNAGTLDAMVGLITNNLNGNPIGVGNQVPNYARYTTTYSDGVAIAPNHLLEAGYSETFKVKVEYRTDINPGDLPSTLEELTFTFGVQYVQANANSIHRPTPSFATDSWYNIINNVRSGNYSFYHVGDTKTIELGNSLGTHTIRIANTSTPAECATTGFSQTACGFVLEFADIITTHNMNPSGEYKGTTYPYGWNVDGWPASPLYAYLNDKSDPTSIINSLPEILKNAIITTTVVSGHGPTAGETNFITTDKLYLLSAHEIWEDDDGNTADGIDYYDSSYHNTRQLDYYAGLNVTTSSNLRAAIKKLGDAYEFWWLRSAYPANPSRFLNTLRNGNWGHASATDMIGVSPAFRIG